MYLVFDTETTGLPKNFNAPISDLDNWPRMVQIAWQLHDKWGNIIDHKDFLIKPEGFNIPYDAEKIHGISTELAATNGIPLAVALDEFNLALEKAKFNVGHNINFDLNIVGAEFLRAQKQSELLEKAVLDTCTEETANLLKLPGGRGGRYKLPTLTELNQYLFHENFAEAHNATADVEATTRCFLELIRTDKFSVETLQEDVSYLTEFKNKNPESFKPIGLKHINLKKASEELAHNTSTSETSKNKISDEDKKHLDEATFVHLHNHTQFSILQSTMSVQTLVKGTAEFNMPGVAITDHGNMMGAFHFVQAIENHNKPILKRIEEAKAKGEILNLPVIKPIVGCEFYVCENHLDKSKKDNGYQIVLLAKNKNGYQNLIKLSSMAYTSGFYYVPRIDKKLIEQYKEDLIVLSGNLSGEIPSKILNIGESQAEEALIWWKNQFGVDFYIEIMRHGNLEEEKRANETLIKLAKKHQVKLVATNNTYYLKKEDANAHDILLCVRDAEKQTTPIGRGRGYRFGMPNDEYALKSPIEMKKIFQDIPEAIFSIQEILDKIEPFSLHRDILLPKFDIPQEFQKEEDLVDGGKRGENAYLKYLTYEGAKKRYPDLTDDIIDRIEFELATIEKTGYPGYFLIVQDFIAAAREMGVSVGPGRGSAAGSAAAYCLGITNIDPIKYDLLFERFLNPDRVSMPDIDIDFDDEGRGRVMDYVIEKYGKNQVAQIITYGSMATKSSIRDTARVLDLPLQDADRIAKLIPAMMPGKWNLSRFLSENIIDVKNALKNSDEFDRIKELIDIANEGSLAGNTIQQAKILEGSLRNTGIHACGVIITPDDITNFVPVTTAKDSDLFVTQFDNSVAESAGLLKMDFLGLKTLSLIKDTVELVKHKHGITLDPDLFPIDDPKTFELFQKGETVGVFQYESPGMQKHMRDLKPTAFEDLIAMNALYRPGPLEYIPSFIKRKNGEEEIIYDLEACEEFLRETYGITVYQEQVMLLSQKLANFSKGDADVLRKAMGKKQKEVLDKMKSKFIDQAVANGHDEKKLDKIWRDWEAFASYAFNKSHSTCYAWVAYQTAYLKANYPAEYMAAVLSNNMSDIKQVTFFMEECRRMGLNVLGPDVNESFNKFTVNEENAIRFGMAAIKGVGKAAVDSLIAERNENGKFSDIFDMVQRVELRTVNKKTFENLILSGAVDSFKLPRAQYFIIEDNMSALEKIIKYGNNFQAQRDSSQTSLFGDSDGEVSMPTPILQTCEEWNSFYKLNKEKEVLGIYLSSHPLDDYRHGIKMITSHTIQQYKEHENDLLNREITIGGMITDAQNRIAKNGNEYGSFFINDYSDQLEFRVFGEDYLKYKHFMQENMFVSLRFKVTEKIFKDKDGTETGRRIFTNIIKMQLLNDILENQAKKLVLKLEVDDLNFENFTQILDILQKYRGNKPLEIKLFMNEEKMKLDLFSKNTQVDICKELLSEIEEIENLSFNLN